MRFVGFVWLIRMRQYQEDMRDENLDKDEKLETNGWESYLNQ